MFEEIRVNVQEDSGEIRENVQENSGECSRVFRGLFKKIPGMLKKISGNLNLDLFVKFCLFLSNSAIKLRKNKGIFSALLITT